MIWTTIKLLLAEMLLSKKLFFLIRNIYLHQTLFYLLFRWILLGVVIFFLVVLCLLKIYLHLKIFLQILLRIILQILLETSILPQSSIRNQAVPSVITDTVHVPIRRSRRTSVIPKRFDDFVVPRVLKSNVANTDTTVVFQAFYVFSVSFFQHCIFDSFG